MGPQIDAATLKAGLSDGAEIALIDVREAGQFGAGHLFFAVPVPYSRFEIELPRLVPNPAVRLVLHDGGDGVAEKAALRARALGFRNVTVLAGGIEAWRRAGYTIYSGVNVPSKTFGELVEHQRHTPRITAAELQAMRAAGENFVIVDGRPFSEFQKMSIPGGICCPNGELALRIKDIAPDPATRIVVNCAGRTRSIIGAQTLIDFGIENPVLALENGTQGWVLAGFALEHGADRRYPPKAGSEMAGPRSRARALAQRHGVGFPAAGEVAGWLGSEARTTYLLDVRTSEEAAETPAGPGFSHAPGGQLIQATDQWVGVKGARIVLADTDGIRAPVVAAWLRQLGHEAFVLEGGLAAARTLDRPPLVSGPGTSAPALLTAAQLASLMAGATPPRIIDLRSSFAFRKAHIAGATWSIRPRILAAAADPAAPLVLICDEPAVAALAAGDLAAAGCGDIRMLAGSQAAWEAAGYPTQSTPTAPADADCIDFLFFVHNRHDGNLDAMRAYLAWETALLGQLDAQERGAFRLGGQTTKQGPAHEACI